MKIVGISLVALTVSACNTIEGMGRDIESAGGAIEKTANENK
ncbi:entericidin A/B family lipoprotein [Ponticaulis profundi]|uniref:Entericidin A/B family lipoprotein n=1 Tax=Ponticaulis profundi TaxID=2665222 RepID=A0ABW1SBI0_9PROT